MNEEHPLVILDLGIPFLVESITISLFEPTVADRKQPLVVEISADGETWTQVFDHEATIAAAHAVANRRANTEADLPPGHAELIEPVIWDVLLGDYASAAARMKARGFLDRDQKNAVVRVINDRILHARELEWTTHGVKRSFRFWSIEEKQAYLSFTMEVIRVLNAAGFRACLGYGSVLSIIRDGDFIPHDDDMDVIVSAPIEVYGKLSLLLKVIGQQLESLGMISLPVKNGTHAHVSVKTGVGRASKSKSTDVFVGFQEDQHVSWYPGQRKAFLFEDIFPPKSMLMLKVSCLVSRDVERYLNVVYGDDWRTPKPRWHHPPSLKQYADWF